MNERLRKIFLDTCASFSPNAPAHVLWKEIEEKYSHPKRHYHNLTHLSNMFNQLEQCESMIHDWDCVVFALFYHDYIYKSTAKDNEEQSAEEAKRKLSSLGFANSKISLVHELIIATKTHQQHQNPDINLFTDADLSILGSSRDEYDQYTKQVRQEYSIYPDILYKPGRRKVLQHFLDMPFIYKSEFFRHRLETIARQNIAWELEKY